MNRYIGLDVEVVTESALAVKFTDGDKEFWVPKRVMDEWPEVGESGTALIEEWFAEKEGLI
jgi:hypothetical protein